MRDADGTGAVLRCIYDRTYREMPPGAKHPDAPAKPRREAFPEIWKEIGPQIRTATETGKATRNERLLLFLERGGYPEEMYHTFSYGPLAGGATRCALRCTAALARAVATPLRVAH